MGTTLAPWGLVFIQSYAARLGTKGLIVTGVALALIAASVIALGALTIAG
jgi:hypothetical protein